MKLDSKPSDDWMPKHYIDLQCACLKYRGASIVTPVDWGLKIAMSPMPHVKFLSSAASKFRLAKLCEGLQEPEKEVKELECVGNRYFEGYSAQALVMLSFVALETHLRMMGIDWKEYKFERTKCDYKKFAQAIRDDFGLVGFTKLKNAMDQEKLQKRLDRFWNGSDSDLLAALSAIRNSFAHGKMGISRSISLDCAVETRKFLLSLIEKDCELVTLSLSEQDKSPLFT